MTQHEVADSSCKCALPPLQPPAFLLIRPLVVDDRGAMSFSAEAMARNMLLSFQTAVQWRVDTWATGFLNC
jgi:hypothetical protein